VSRAEARGVSLPRRAGGNFLNRGVAVWQIAQRGGPACDAAWRRGTGGPGGGRTCERQSRVATGWRGNAGQGRHTEVWHGGVWAAPGERGPAGGEGKWVRAKENITLLDFFENISKRLELIRSNCVLPEF
jgi:hypothetical protein